MGYCKNKQIEEREIMFKNGTIVRVPNEPNEEIRGTSTSGYWCPDFDVKAEEKEAMSIFYREQDAKLRTRKLNRFADLAVLFLVCLASLGAGALLTIYLMEMFYG